MRFLSFAVLSLCLLRPAGADDYSSNLGNMISGYVQPVTAAFSASASRLPAAISAVCEKRTPDAIDDFRAAYGDTVRAFGKIAFLRFGPLVEDDRLSRLAFLPDPRGIAQRQIRKIMAAGDNSVLDAASLAGKSVAVQGLTALQLIAFDKSTEVVLGEPGNRHDFTCGYALAISENVSSIAARLDAAWNDHAGHSRQLLEAGQNGSPFNTSKEAMEQVFNSLVTGLIIVKDQDILPVLGSSPEKARASRMPFSRSGNGVAYVKAELEGLQEAINAFQFQADLFEGYERVANSLEFEFGQARAALDRLDPPIRRTFAESGAYDQLKLTTFILSSLRDTMNGRLAEGLALSGGFNALDGD